MNHQQIINALVAAEDAMIEREVASKARHAEEVRRLRSACAEIGHLYRSPTPEPRSSLDRCIVCDGNGDDPADFGIKPKVYAAG